MLKTPVSFEVASWHKNPLQETPCITHHLLLQANWRFQIHYRAAELQNCHKQMCLQDHVSGDFLPSPAYIKVLVFPGSCPISFSLCPRYRRNMKKKKKPIRKEKEKCISGLKHNFLTVFFQIIHCFTE